MSSHDEREYKVVQLCCFGAKHNKALPFGSFSFLIKTVRVKVGRVPDTTYAALCVERDLTRTIKRTRQSTLLGVLKFAPNEKKNTRRSLDLLRSHLYNATTVNFTGYQHYKNYDFTSTIPQYDRGDRRAELP